MAASCVSLGARGRAENSGAWLPGGHTEDKFAYLFTFIRSTIKQYGSAENTPQCEGHSLQMRIWLQP